MGIAECEVIGFSPLNKSRRVKTELASFWEEGRSVGELTGMGPPCHTRAHRVTRLTSARHNAAGSSPELRARVSSSAKGL